MDVELQRTLQHLIQQLDQSEQLDASDRTRLRQAVEEIQDSLSREDVHSGGLAQRLHEMTEDFQAAHPQLTRTAGQIADTLAQMGI